MYRPAHFRQDDARLVRAAVREHPFATIAVCGSDGPLAAYVPTLLDDEPAPHGTLHFHIARANPLREAYRAGETALAIFTGPHGYVSPAGYPTRAASGAVVPTWNYVAVEARGPLEFYDDTERLRALVTRLTDANEGEAADRWRVGEAPEAFVAAQLRGIAGVRMTIARLEGKWKLGQNRPPEDRAGTIERLERSGRRGDAELAAAMRRALLPGERAEP